MTIMELSNEDKLRLNVLLAQKLQAIRINEGSMTLHALTDQGEAKIVFNPTTQDDQYLRMVREFLSLKITGSPGGYPVFLRRWTRMGHADNTLEHMLLLGEPEAVIAVVYSPDVPHDIGKRAWWSLPTTEVAMRLMEYPKVVKGELAKELADYLMEFLPFEEKQLNVVDMVRLCLQKTKDDKPLITEKQLLSLWSRAKRKNPFYVGFLHANPQLIPLKTKPSKHFHAISEQIQTLSDSNIYAKTLLELLDKDGQKWLETLKLSLKKPVDQDVVISLFTAISNHFKLPIHTLRLDKRGTRSIEIAIQHTEEICGKESQNSLDSSHCHKNKNNDLTQLIEALDEEYLPLVNAMLVLAQMGEHTLIPIFSGNESVGTVMRKRLLPLTTPLLEKVDILM